MSRFTDIDDNVVEMFLDVMERRFPSLVQLKIKLILTPREELSRAKFVWPAQSWLMIRLNIFLKMT